MKEILYTFSFSNEKNRWPLWYIIALSILIWFIIWWFFTRQYVMSFMFILMSWVYFFVENNASENTNVEISKLWIKINSQFYDYSKILSYAIFYKDEYPHLLRLTLNKKWLKNIDLKISDKIFEELNNILPNYIKQDENAELNFVDKLILFLKL